MNEECIYCPHLRQNPEFPGEYYCELKDHCVSPEQYETERLDLPVVDLDPNLPFN